MQRVSRDVVKWKQVNIAWTWLVEMAYRSENANENKWFGFNFEVNQNLSEQTRDVIVDKIHGKLLEIGLKVKQSGYDLHMFEVRKVCEMQGGANIVSRALQLRCETRRNRFKPGMLFCYSFFRHIRYVLIVCSVFLLMFVSCDNFLVMSWWARAPHSVRGMLTSRGILCDWCPCVIWCTFWSWWCFRTVVIYAVEVHVTF